MTYSPRARRFTIAAAIVATVASPIIWTFVHRASAQNPPQPKAPPAVPVTTVQVRAQEVPVYRVGVGTVVAAQSVTVKPRIDGQLDKVAFTEGQDVKAGQLLAQIDHGNIPIRRLARRFGFEFTSSSPVMTRAQLTIGV